MVWMVGSSIKHQYVGNWGYVPLDVWLKDFNEASHICNYTASVCCLQVPGPLYFGWISEKTVMLKWNSHMSFEVK